VADMPAFTQDSRQIARCMFEVVGLEERDAPATAGGTPGAEWASGGNARTTGSGVRISPVPRTTLLQAFDSRSGVERLQISQELEKRRTHWLSHLSPDAKAGAKVMALEL
jgi:hypothetical protein